MLLYMQYKFQLTAVLHVTMLKIKYFRQISYVALMQSLSPVTRVPVLFRCFLSNQALQMQFVLVAYSIQNDHIDLHAAGSCFHPRQQKQFSVKCLKVTGFVNRMASQDFLSTQYFPFSFYQMTWSLNATMTLSFCTLRLNVNDT